MSYLRIVALAGCLLCAAVACDRQVAAPPERLRPVVVHSVAAPEAIVARSFAGATAAVNSAEVAFEVSGRITAIQAVRGRRYEAGVILAQLDTATYEAELRRAEAESTRANDELRRVQQLFENDTASRAQFDSAMAAQRTAQATLSTAEKRVEDGTIRMPYAGVIGEVLKEEQEFAAAGSPLLRIQGDGGMEMEVGVPGDVIAAIELNMGCSVRIGSLPGVAVTGQVSQISREVSRNTTYLVTLALSSPPGVDLREGLDGEATFQLPNPKGATIAIPGECVVGAPAGTTYVWIVEANGHERGAVRRRDVKTGDLRPSGRIEILSGLRAGELVVTRGVHQLLEGTQVRLESLGGQ
ncbi:MAG: efflux RND transporter periplasmic adaptor subunit [Planctomycetota bacterium]